MLNKCIVEFDISGKKRGLKFGTLSVRLIMEMRKITSLMDLIVEMESKANIPFIIDLLYCSAQAYCISNKQEIDFTKYDVADWMDEIGIDTSMSIINKAFTQYNAPEDKPQEKKSLWRRVLERIGLLSTGKRLQYHA